MMLREVGNWLLVFLTLVWCTFTLIYAFRSKWWANEGWSGVVAREGVDVSGVDSGGCVGDVEFVVSRGGM